MRSGRRRGFRLWWEGWGFDVFALLRPSRALRARWRLCDFVAAYPPLKWRAVGSRPSGARGKDPHLPKAGRCGAPKFILFWKNKTEVPRLRPFDFAQGFGATRLRLVHESHGSCGPQLGDALRSG